MEYQALFFDFDGVIADSLEVKAQAFADMFKQYGPEIQARVVDHHRKNGGVTRREKFHHYYRGFLNMPISENDMDDLCRKFSDLVVDRVTRSPEIRGAGDFLEIWHQKALCFIVSATPDEEIKHIVKKRGLNKYFREVHGSSRTKTEILNSLIKKYILDAGKCAYFGDAESDYWAAKNSGVPFIGILPGSNAPLLGVNLGITWKKNFMELLQSGWK